MKTYLTFFCLILAGCQTAAPVQPPVAAKPLAESRPVAVAPSDSNSALAQKIRQQAQYIDALISRNEALTAKLANGANSPAPAHALSTIEPAATVTPVVPPSFPEAPLEMVAPNADGVIDLTAAPADAKSTDNVNPFAIRTAGSGPVREVTLRVSGLLGGKTPCAIINDRLVQVNEAVETLTVERIGEDWVCLQFNGQRLRVPVSDQSVKVKLPL